MKEAFCPFDYRIDNLTRLKDRIEANPISLARKRLPTINELIEFNTKQKVICCNQNKAQKAMCGK